MTKIQKDDDAAQHAPKPEAREADAAAKPDKQDAKNYADATDGGRALPVEKINSANDE